MKLLIIFDSNYGNTKKIAETIGRELGAQVKSVSEISDEDLKGLDLLIAGSPIHGWRPSERMVKFLAGLKDNQLEGVEAATFDTRVKLFIHGDAAKKIAKALKNAGAETIVEPQAIYVKGKEGPLLEGELEKAKEFTKMVITEYESISKTN